MGEATGGGPPRPVRIGELLDRAITLCVRFFLPLALVEAVSAVAQGAYSLYTGSFFGSVWNDVAADVRGHPLVAAPSPGGATGFALLLILFVEPVVGGALIAMTSSLYLGESMSFGRAYRIAATRALPLATLAAIFLASMVALIALGVICIAFGVTFVSGIASYGGIGRSAAIAVGGLLGVAAVLALGITASAMLLAFSLSSIACVLEGVGAVRAIALCIRRSFATTRLGRTLIFAAANLAIIAGCEIIVSSVNLALPFLRSGIFAAVFETVAFATAALVGNAFCCLYYYGLRAREEGFAPFA